jgi:enamine deaminase RidA (YjgF/YER057c/UK114 family)
MKVERFFSGAPWEKKVAYCRVLRAGTFIFVSGTAPVDEQGKVFEPKNAYAQARRCLEIIQQSLQKAGVPLSCVVRTRMFVTDISAWADYGRAHQEFFADHPPVTSMIEVQGLIDPEMMIEIEAEAICE